VTEQTTIGAIGQCGGCGGLLFANVFHVCIHNIHLYEGSIPKAELDQLASHSYVPPPPMANDSGVFSEPPDVIQKTGRTNCEACGEALNPTVMHTCRGNWRFHTAKSKGGYVDDSVVTS
jgi:hypothetical protein